MTERPAQPGKSTESSMPLRAHGGWILTLTSMVVAWQMLALVMPLPAATPPGTLLRWLLALLGLFFVATGVWTWLRRPGRATLLFTLYALCGGLHWGGPVAVPETARAGVIAMYLTLSSLLGQTILVHLALAFPPAWRRSRSRPLVVFLYTPSAAAAVLSLALWLGTGMGDAPRGVLATLLALSTPLTVVALVVFAARFARARRLGDDARSPAIVVVGLILGSLPWLLASAVELPGPTDLYNLFFALHPAAIAVALLWEGRRQHEATP